MTKTINFFALAKILFIGALMSIMSFFTQDRVTWHSLFNTPGAKDTPTTPRFFETIELAEALRLYYSKRSLFLDVREHKYFCYGSVLGAENLDPDNIDSVSADTLQRWKDKEALVIYCNGFGCGTALYAARGLATRGFTNIKVYAGGWPEWRAYHLPMAMSQEMQNEEAKAREN